MLPALAIASSSSEESNMRPAWSWAVTTENALFTHPLMRGTEEVQGRTEAAPASAQFLLWGRGVFYGRLGHVGFN